MTESASSGASLTQRAYEIVLDEIISCHLLPGTWITERQIASRLDVGLTPVHGALTQLTHEGLLIKVPRRGYQVSPMSMISVSNLLHAWKIIVVGIASEAAVRCTAEAISDLQSLVANNEPPVPHSRANHTGRRAWAILNEIVGNPILTSIYDRLDRDVYRVYRFLETMGNADQAALAGMDQAWLDAMSRHDAEGLSRLVARHIDLLKDRVLQTIARSSAVMSVELTG